MSACFALPGLRPVAAPSALVCSLLTLFIAAAPAHAQTTTLAPVVVTATRFPADAAMLPFGVSVLTAGQIKASGVTTVNDALMKLLGLPGRLDFYGGGDYAIDLRGFGSTAGSNQAVIVDGIRIDEADLGGTRLAGINIDAVERIEVLRGSAAVLYGEGATGGAIVITTRAGRGTAQASQGSLYAAAGSNALRDVRGGATLAMGEFSIDAAANRRESDNHRQNFRSETDGASLAGQWRNDWLRAGARYGRDQLDGGLPGSLTAAQYAADPRQAGSLTESSSISNHHSGLFAEATLGAWQIAFDAGWRDKALTYNGTGFVYAYDVDARNQSARARHAAQFGSVAHSFVAGIDHGEWQRTVAGAFGSVANQRSLAFYAREDVTLASGTRLSAGARTERIRKDNSSTPVTIDQRPNAWELGVVQPVLAGVVVFGRVGRSFRLANVDEFGFTAQGKSLQPQRSRDLDAGLRWAEAGSGARSAELRLYRSALTHEIGYDPNAIGPFDAPAGPGSGANVNYDATRRQGVEVVLTQPLGARANLRVNAATRRAHFSAGAYADKDVPLTPRHTLAVRADWQPSAGHRLDAGLQVVSSQYPDFANACRMPSYTTADARYAYQWGRAELALGVTNLGDARHYTLAFRCANGAPSAIYPEAGRSVTASLRVGF